MRRHNKTAPVSKTFCNQHIDQKTACVTDSKTGKIKDKEFACRLLFWRTFRHFHQI